VNGFFAEVTTEAAARRATRGDEVPPCVPKHALFFRSSRLAELHPRPRRCHVPCASPRLFSQQLPLCTTS